MEQKKTWARETTGMLVLWVVGTVSWMLWNGHNAGVSLMQIIIPMVFTAYGAAFVSKAVRLNSEAQTLIDDDLHIPPAEALRDAVE